MVEAGKPHPIVVEEHKTHTIIVEGTPHEWPEEEISYEDVVTLEVPDYSQHPDIKLFSDVQGRPPQQARRDPLARCLDKNS